jgi:hypothetical protein
MNRSSKRTLLLRADGYSWRVLDGATGWRVLEFSQAEYARMWLRDCGYEHTGNMAGESHAEVWTKGGKR